jgi:fused signal recognition particle receptor
MDASLLQSFAHWTAEHPVASVLGVFGLPSVLLIVVELVRVVRRRRARRAEVVAPPSEPEARRLEGAPQVAAAPALEAAPEVTTAPAAEPAPEVAAAPAAEAAPPVGEAPPPPEPVRLRDRLRRTSDALVGRMGQLLAGRRVDEELIDELEMLLFGADLGVKMAQSLLDEVRKSASGQDAGGVRRILRSSMLETLRCVEPRGGLEIAARPHVILVLGVNGSGKTTTIGKLAARYTAQGHRVILGAADTFRAAAIEQLQAWGERVGCDVIAGRPGSDPSAVAFDTVKAAVARRADVAIVDTAGRLQTKKPLMEQLGKMVRVIGRDLEGAPHETLLVLDANTGQNAISQARLFTEVASVSGLVLTKLDGTAKGGVILGLAAEFGIPLKHVGVGEAVEDLRDFSAEEFVEAIFAE